MVVKPQMQTTRTVSFNSLRASVFRAIAGQDYENGFILDLSPLPTRKLIISAPIAAAISKFRCDSPSLAHINPLIAEITGVPPRGGVLCAMWYIVNDLFDVMSVTGGQPLDHVYDIGSGLGLHAALLNSKWVSLHEVANDRNATARTLFNDNGIESFSINAPPEAPADILCSFLACGYLFPLADYLPHMRLSKRALLDLNKRYAGPKADAVINTFPKKTAMRDDGVGVNIFTRTLLSR